MPPELVESETKWFYNELGIDDMYFATETVDA
jgi:glutamate dehydrogenase